MIELIRQMQDSDLSQVVDIHMDAFSGHRSTSLGRRFVSAEYRWFLQNYPQLALIYQKEGLILGFVTGAYPGYPSVLAAALWRNILFALMTHPWLLFDCKTWFGVPVYLTYAIRWLFCRSSKVKSQEVVSNSVELASIGVSVGVRGQGIAGRLMDVFEKKVAELGVLYVTLTVWNDNHAAKRAYEKAGWRVAGSHDYVIKYQKNCIRESAG